MALAKTITTNFGIEVPHAYHRVSEVTIVEKALIAFTVSAYADKAARAVSTAGHQCAYDIAGDNPIKQAYEHLKTLPEFADAADV